MLQKIKTFDWKVLTSIYRMKRPLPLNVIMLAVTTSGNGGIVWFFFAALLFIKGAARGSERKAGIAILLSLAISFLVGNIILKNTIQRKRPYDQTPQIRSFIPPPGDFSFPSGHAYSSFSSATAFLLFSHFWGIPAFFLASMIAFSRIYFCVHFPSDIFASLILGVGTGLLVHIVL